MIRNFIYLDSDKLRSFSSQIFEGVIEEVIEIHEQETSESEQQAGKFASGRLLGDIFRQKASTSERYYLDDYAYNLFEDKLIADKIINIDSNRDFGVGSFVKVFGPLTINDYVHSARILRNFNALGEAFWRVTNDPMAIELKPNARKPANDAKAKEGAAASSMQFHPKVVEASAHIMEFGYGDHIEFNLKCEERLYSSPIKRQFLREPDDIIVSKYSRAPDQRFHVVGLVTQIGRADDISGDIDDVSEAPSIREAMRLLAGHANIFEKVFRAPTIGEYILDPIAIYSEI